MNPKNNILIVGGTGFIGYHLAKKSLAKGWQVTSISSKSPKKIRYLSKVKYIICDITKSRLLKKSIRKPFDYVVNLGGYVDHSNKQKTLKSHYEGCKNLTEIFLKKAPLSFVQIGSSLEYGNSNSPQNINNILKKGITALKVITSDKALIKVKKSINKNCNFLFFVKYFHKLSRILITDLLL